MKKKLSTEKARWLESFRGIHAHPCTRFVYAVGKRFANLKTAAGLTSKSLLHAMWAVLQSPFHLPDVDAFSRTDLCELMVRMCA
jgi:hypothetical protein